jgi:hypothetical protein
MYVSFEYKISCPELDIFGGHFVNLTLFWPKNSRKVQNGLDQKGDVLEKKVIWDFFLELDVVVESRKISILKFPIQGDIDLSSWHGMAPQSKFIVEIIWNDWKRWNRLKVMKTVPKSSNGRVPINLSA